MAANAHRRETPALARVAIVPLGGAEPTDALTRASRLGERVVAVRPPLEELLESGLVVFCGRDSLVADAIATLRQSRGALLPAFALVDEGRSRYLDPSWTGLADVVLPRDATLAQIASALENLDAIGAAVAALPADEAARGDADRRRQRALRFLVTRGTAALAPALSTAARGLFRYGAIDGICGDHAADDLAALEKAGFLKSEIAERVYRCACGDARLHFRDVCEHCRSSALATAHVMRHQCGHSAPSADFWRGEELACPACGAELKVAGQDYEGPIDEIRCTACNKGAREGLTLATCAGCGASTPADKLAALAVKRFALTEAGRTAALVTAATAESAEMREKRAALLETWKRIAAARPKTPAALVRVASVDAEDLDRVLSAALRGSDAAIRLGGDGFLALLAGTGRDGAEWFVERVAGRAHGDVQILCYPDEQAAIDAALKPLAAEE